ncbi:unnamed protein product [Ostreobium quekettii]|uniref:FAD synthase n=1 Tax=Ostreobium quekettii TaxID=121088 RepID=A0A8S1IM83_9CHLO|nr:unnamed protein product [Ostreobium quekettii]
MSLGTGAFELPGPSGARCSGQPLAWRFAVRRYAAGAACTGRTCRQISNGISEDREGKVSGLRVVDGAVERDHGVVENPGVGGAWRSPLCQEGTLAPIVALGKFDSMHIGHRALAQAAATLGGTPWLISFSGMAKILGWQERLPIVPLCEKARVLASWSPFCGGLVPSMRYLPFEEIRGLSPEDFVRLLAEELGAKGIVAGQNYKFGYKASGDARLLEALGTQYGLQVKILDLVTSDEKVPLGEVSTTQVRKALDQGDMRHVARLLGRSYRLVSRIDGRHLASCRSVPCSAFLNQPPAEGEYTASIQVHSSQRPNFAAEENLAMGPLRMSVIFSADSMVLDGGSFRQLDGAEVVRLTADF